MIQCKTSDLFTKNVMIWLIQVASKTQNVEYFVAKTKAF